MSTVDEHEITSEASLETTPGIHEEQPADTHTGVHFHIETSHMPVLRQLSVAMGLLVVVFGATYIGTVKTLVRQEANAEDVVVEKRVTPVETSPASISDTFADTRVTAKAAFVWDVREKKILFSKNADDPLPLASITKLMTALVAYELLDSTDTVNISVDAIKTDGDSGLKDGEQFSVRDLTDLVLVASSNDGAAALSAAAGTSIGATGNPSTAFVDAMNIRAGEIGLSKTHFSNATGLDLSTSEAGAYGTAHDIALLMEYIITHYPDVVALTRVDMTTVDNAAGEYHLAKNTNEVVDTIDGLIASKTGYTELAGGNLVVAFDAGLNRPIVVSVLGSTREGRFNDVLDLVARARATILTEGS